MKKMISILALTAIIYSSGYAALQYEALSQNDAADYLAQQDIIQDHSSNPDDFRLSDSITRQETIKIIMKLSGLEILDTCNGTFSDVQEGWGCKYIEKALEQGYVASNELFRPTDDITKTEVAKLVLKVKNIEKIQVTDNWQEDYMKTLTYYGLIADEYTDYDTPATRGWIFQIVTATLKKEPEIKQYIEKETQLMSNEA